MGAGTERERILSSPDPEIAYRPIAAMAVVSLVLGVLSLLAFVHPILWLIPPLALVVAIRTSMQLEIASREYAGQVLAKIAILVALVAGIGSATRYFTQWAILIVQARSYSDTLIDEVLTNRIVESFYLTSPPQKRVGMEAALDQLLIRSGSGYREYTKSDIVKTLGGKGREAQVTYLGFGNYGFDGGFVFVDVLYRISIEALRYDVRILARGAVAERGEWSGRQWYAENIQVKPSEPGATP